MLSTGAVSARAAVPGPVGGLTATAGANQATVSWTAPGGTVLYYVVSALSGGTAARNTTAVAATSSTITGLTGGTAYKFSVYGVNAEGKGTATTTAASITPTGITTPYTSAVFADTPTFFDRLDETAGTTALDSSGNGSTGTEINAPTQGAEGLLATDTDKATVFNGTTQYEYGNTSYVDPTTFSVEAWFKAPAGYARGGRMIGFRAPQVGTATQTDRMIYMNNAGQLIFGVYPGEVQTIKSTTAYNDGKVHYVVATLSTAGMFLYVDGALVASNTKVTTAQAYTGWWTFGGYDNLNGWSETPTSTYFDGTLGQLAVYPTALSLQRVQVHYCDGASVNCLSMTSPTTVTFKEVKLNGTTTTETEAVPFDVTDNSGGNGWNIAATSTTFKSGTHELPATATTVAKAPTAACETGFTCTLPTNAVSYPYTLPAAATAPTATVLASAAVGTGMGHTVLTPTFSLAVPSNTHVGTYTSTWTFTLSSGP